MHQELQDGSLLKRGVITDKNGRLIGKKYNETAQT
jgi:hypothetical protein